MCTKARIRTGTFVVHWAGVPRAKPTSRFQHAAACRPAAATRDTSAAAGDHHHRLRRVAVGHQEIAVGGGKEQRAEHVAADKALDRIGPGVIEDQDLAGLRHLVGEVESRPQIAAHPVIAAEPGVIQQPGIREKVLAERPFSQVPHARLPQHGRRLSLKFGVKRIVEQVDELAVAHQQVRLGPLHGISDFIEQFRVGARAVNVAHRVSLPAGQRIDAVQEDAAIEEAGAADGKIGHVAHHQHAAVDGQADSTCPKATTRARPVRRANATPVHRRKPAGNTASRRPTRTAGGLGSRARRVDASARAEIQSGAPLTLSRQRTWPASTRATYIRPPATTGCVSLPPSCRFQSGSSGSSTGVVLLPLSCESWR